MKKHTIWFILSITLLSLPLISNADDTIPDNTIRDIYEQAASGWHQTYEAYGRTVEVDIPIQVPDVNAFPVLTVIEMPALDSLPITDWEGYNQGNDKYFNEDGFFRWDTPAREITAAAAQENLIKPPKGMDAMEITVRLNQLDWDTAYAYNNSSTVRDMDAFIKTKWNEFFPDEPVSFIPHSVDAKTGMRYYDYNTDEYSGDPWPHFQGLLMVYFDQVMHDIPILCYAARSFTQYAGVVNDEEGYVGGIAIAIGLEDIGLEDVFYSMQYSLVKEQQEIAADVPLIDLEQVIATYEQLIAEGKLRSVSSLRLGYVLWRNKSDAQSHTMMPMWVLEGELFKSASADYLFRVTQDSGDPMEYGFILINAQTGEWINPWNTDSRRSYNTTELITWEAEN